MHNKYNNVNLYNNNNSNYYILFDFFSNFYSISLKKIFRIEDIII